MLWELGKGVQVGLERAGQRTRSRLPAAAGASQQLGLLENTQVSRDRVLKAQLSGRSEVAL